MEAATHRIATPAPATTSSADRPAPPADERALPQLGLRGIIAVWAAAAVPMGLLAWVAAPLLADQLSGPGALVRALIITLTAGLVWQFVLVITLVRREQGTLRWPVVRDALWLRAPRAPRTGRRGGKLWLVVLPLIVASAVEGLLVIPGPAARDFAEFLGSDAGEGLLAGSWGWFAIIAALSVFNTVLGEELLFRGYLLPRMNGRFGRRDWLANGVLFAGYHLHTPWVIPTTLLDTFILSYPSKRYRSALIGIAVHSAQSIARARARARVGAQGLSTRARPRSAGAALEATPRTGRRIGGPFCRDARGAQRRPARAETPAIGCLRESVRALATLSSGAVPWHSSNSHHGPCRRSRRFGDPAGPWPGLHGRSPPDRLRLAESIRAIAID